MARSDRSKHQETKILLLNKMRTEIRQRHDAYKLRSLLEDESVTIDQRIQNYRQALYKLFPTLSPSHRGNNRLKSRTNYGPRQQTKKRLWIGRRFNER